MSRFKSIVQASLLATKKALTWNLEELMPPVEKYIFNFNSKEEVKKWHLYSDSEYGGMSSASLEVTDVGDGLKGLFSGNLSMDVMEGTKWSISRSGFCGMRSKKFEGYIDLDAYDTISLKLKGDGRCYISTIYTENWVKDRKKIILGRLLFMFLPETGTLLRFLLLDIYQHGEAM